MTIELVAGKKVLHYGEDVAVELWRRNIHTLCGNTLGNLPHAKGGGEKPGCRGCEKVLRRWLDSLTNSRQCCQGISQLPSDQRQRDRRSPKTVTARAGRVSACTATRSLNIRTYPEGSSCGISARSHDAYLGDNHDRHQRRPCGDVPSVSRWDRPSEAPRWLGRARSPRYE